jgi:hypothetical protein
MTWYWESQRVMGRGYDSSEGAFANPAEHHQMKHFSIYSREGLT